MIFPYKILLCILYLSTNGLELPDSCRPGHYYDPGLLECHPCMANMSMVVSSNGFSCACEEHSVPSGINRCRPCNTTEVVSQDGAACVPRKCQVSGGKTVCRKCPADYISVTQNFDGSPTKEVLCVRCARGFKPHNNVCVRCAACSCARNEIIVRGACVPKKFVTERPKHDVTVVHPLIVLDVMKHEYFCTQNDFEACRALTVDCVRQMYTTDLAGPCRLWVQPKITTPKGLPQLTLDSPTEKDSGSFKLPHGKENLTITVIEYTSIGMRMLQDPQETDPVCLLPVTIQIGKDISVDCRLNLTEIDVSLYNNTYAPYLLMNGEYNPLWINIRKPNGDYVKKNTWPSKNFLRYFIIHNSPSTVSNISDVIYLRTLYIRLHFQRDKIRSLQFSISVDAHYATTTSLSQAVTTSLRVEHVFPSARLLRSLEIWGGVLGALFALYAGVQWRGAVRRGSLYVSLVPLLAGSIADALYFAAWFASLHALAAEAGTLGLTLPLSHSEEHMIKAFVYSAVGLKALKIIWINWNQCTCDIFFLDWTQYNPPSKGTIEGLAEKSDSWRASYLCREWTTMQTKRKACPGFTVTLTLAILYLMQPWLAHIPDSVSYKWTITTLAWISSYLAILAARWLLDTLLGSPTRELANVCSGVGMSLLVFQEEYYAHYVHGRNDITDTRSMSSALAACRVVCAPQLRSVYKQLASTRLVGLGETDSKQTLLSRFLAAFFERALDGVSWVASERTILERLLDIETTVRENGNTSTLLYGPEGTPSCFLMTWWGEEWSLGTFDGMVFGSVFVITQDAMIAALVTVLMWQILKNIRYWFGTKNVKEKTVP